MIWFTILMMAGIVFLSRYLFLEPKLPLKLNMEVQRILTYAAPAILSAIWAPIVFVGQGELWLTLDNPYLTAAIVTFLLEWKTGNILLSVFISMLIFMIMNLWL